MKKLLVLVLVLGLGGGGFAWWKSNNGNNAGPGFRSAAVERGNLSATISATGTLQPEEVVDVGAQVAGRILHFGKDPHDSTRPIDYNTQVEEGTELAFIDDALYRSDLDQAEANYKQSLAQVEQAKTQVEVAEANLARAEADLDQFKAVAEQTESEWNRSQRLASRPGAISDTDYELAKVNFKAAKAKLSVGDKSILQMRASLKDTKVNIPRAEAARDSAKAARDKSQTNLSYCVIKSPVKGVIVERRVNVGQTVVSSLNAPSLFLIAKDLRRMQIWTSVNEADISQIHVGQKATFTLDGRPGEIFKGEVIQVRLNATVTQNVVNYTVVLNTDNTEGKLLAYQTANVTFEIDRRKDVLMVPNAALRWQPRRELVAPEHREELAALLRRKPAPKPGEKESTEGVLWVDAGEGFVKPIKVKTGLGDGQATEISTDELKPDDHVIIGVQRVSNGGGDDSPFAPKMFSGQRKQQ